MVIGRLTLLGLLVVVAVACSGDAIGSADETPDVAGGADPRSVGILEDAVDGHPPLDTALEAFSVAFGPLPGVERPDFEGRPFPSGTGPLRWVLGHWDELTPQQQRAVEEYVGAGLETGGSVKLAGFGFPSSAEDVDSLALLDLIEQVKGQIEAKLKRKLTVDVELIIAPKANLDGSLMWTQGQSPTGPTHGDMTSCRITIGQPGIPFAQQIDGSGGASPTLTGLIAHELFHCFDNDLSTLQASMKRRPWVTEGLADWVAMEIGGDGSDLEAFGYHWWGWFAIHDVPLFKRSYSAVGFFSHLAETGTDVWSGVDELLVASEQGDVPAYQSITAVAGPLFLDTWASSLVRDATRAPEWDSEGPGVPDQWSSGLTEVEPLAEGDYRLLEAQPNAAGVFSIDLDAEVVFINGVGSGMVLLPDGASLSFDDVDGAVLCTRQDGCTCPDDSPGAATVFRLVPKGPMVVAVTGGPSGIPEGLKGYALELFCEEAVEQCLIGEWVSLRWEIPMVDTAGGAGTVIMNIDRSGEVNLQFDPDFPLFSIAEEGAGVRVRMEFKGGYSFQMGRAGIASMLLGGDARLSSWVELGGSWIQNPDSIDLTGGGLGSIGGAQFICGEDELIVSSADGTIFFAPWP